MQGASRAEGVGRGKLQGCETEEFELRSWLVASPVEHPKAHTALLLGVFSLGCFGFVTGIPGLFISLRAKRDIDRAHGAIGGEGKVITAILMTFVGTIGSLAMITMIAGSKIQHALAQEHLFKARDIGSIKVAVLENRRGQLKSALEKLTKDAAGKPIVVQTRFRKCTACDEFQSALGDPQMQAALGSVVFARVDAGAFRQELEQMHIETKSAPWFYLLGADLKPLDGISAAEWDENVPANMAPVLSAFVHGTFKERRPPVP